MSALAVVMSAFLAAVLLSQTGGLDIMGDPSDGGVLLASGGGVLAAAVIVGSLVSMLVRRRAVVAVLVVVAATTAGITSSVVSPSAFEYVAVVAGGVVWGCAAVLAVSLSGTRLQAMLVAGFLAGLLTAGALDALETDVPDRYHDYLTEAQRSTPVIVPTLAALTILAVLSGCRRPFAGAPEPIRSTRVLFAAIVIPLCGLLTHWLFVRQLYDASSSMSGVFWFGAVAVPVLLVSAAVMPGRSGAAVLAGTAVLAASSTSSGVGLDAGSPAWTYGFIAGTVVAVAVGAGAGVRWKHPTAGFVVLASVCLTALFDRPPLDNIGFVASLVVFPAAAAYTFVSITPATAIATGTATATAIGLAVPAAITVPLVVTYGWTAYTPLTDIDTSVISRDADLWTSTGVGFAAVVLAGIGLRGLRRHRA